MRCPIRVVPLGLLLLALPAQEAPANVSGGELLPEQACFDVRHYELKLRVDPAQQSIAGTLRMRAQLLKKSDKLVLDLDPALTATAVRVDKAASAFEHKDGRLWITPKLQPKEGRLFEVAVDYGGKPRVAKNPPWDGGFTWSKTAAGQPWIATSCQGEGADLWWPCKDQPGDEPDGFDLWIAVPKGLFVASNGVLVDFDQAAADVDTFHWRTQMPINNYGVALNIAPYKVISDSYTSVDGTEVPVQMFVLPEHEERGKAFLPQFKDHVRVFEQLLGPYPWRKEKYGVVETPHLGMEHQTILAYGNGFRDGDKDYDWLHNHELAHEWWGNLITCRDWKDMWLHEGFGSYMQPLYLERHAGVDAYRKEMQTQLQRIRNRRAVAPKEHKTSREIDEDTDIYFKGSWVLHTLRWQLGDEKFFLCLRRFLYPDPQSERSTDGSAARFVDTDEFVQLVNRIAGSDLSWFFELYLRQPRLPQLVVEQQGDRLHLAWKTPNDLPFALAVPLRVGEQMRRVEMPAGKAEVELGGQPYAIDPEQRLLMLRPR